MKIAYVYDVIYPYVMGGVQKRIRELATRLCRRGHDVTIFGMKHWAGNDIIYEEGVRLWGVCPPQDLFKNGQRSTGEALYFACRLLIPLSKERFDTIDAANFPYFPCFSASVNSIVRRSHLVITWHEIWGNYWYEYLGRKGFFGKVMERLTMKLPHRAIAVSESTKRGLEGYGRNEVEVIPTGVDTKLIDAIPPSGDTSDIIYVGRLMEEKGLAQLIREVRLIRERRPEVRCLIIGDGPARERLHSLVSDLGLQDSVRFRGRVDNDSDVFSAMKSSRVLALPSLREGLGLVAIEANACGIPVVTVKHPSNAAQDLITDGENGYVSGLSEGDLADKIVMALESGVNWDAQCREFAKRYEWDAIVDAIEGFYRSR